MASPLLLFSGGTFSGLGHSSTEMLCAVLAIRCIIGHTIDQHLGYLRSIEGGLILPPITAGARIGYLPNATCVNRTTGSAGSGQWLNTGVGKPLPALLHNFTSLYSSDQISTLASRTSGHQTIELLSMTALTMSPHDVSTTVQYLIPGSKNERYFSKGIEVNIGKYEDKNIVVKDARPIRDQYTLETAGFQLVDHKSNVTDFKDRSQLDNKYTAEIAELVKQLSGADKVVILSPPVLRQNKEEPGASYQPRAKDVHTDYSPGNAEWSAQHRAGQEHLSSYSRVVFINVWRCISSPPQDWPLAMVDARTVENDEGVPYPMIIVEKIPDELPIRPLPFTPIEGANFHYKDRHEWRYFSNMTKDEVLAFKLFDSDKDKGNKSWRCPHTAFFDDREGTIPRESVEVRTICYYN